jgi:hypothetical protein
MPPGGIRTHDPSKRSAADLRLRPRRHWDRLRILVPILKYIAWISSIIPTNLSVVLRYILYYIIFCLPLSIAC